MLSYQFFLKKGQGTFATNLKCQIHSLKYQRSTSSVCKDIGIKTCGQNSIPLFPLLNIKKH